MSDKSNTTFRLGDWLVEAELNRLSKPRESIQLEPKSMDVLVYLCEHAGSVVSADEIIEVVWGGRPMGDNPVYKSVAKLRRALGDNSSEPHYIATVAKKGYRLIAPVRPATADATPTIVPTARSGLGRKILPIAIGMLSGAVLAALVFWQPQSDSLTLQSVSSFRGSHSQPSFAPDGNAIAFVNNVDEAANVWILVFGEPTPRQLTSGRFRDSRPRWSPDGDAILFMRGGSLWSVPAGGGEASEIVRDAYNPNWSSDGARIVFERRYEIWTADANGGQQARVAGVPRKELPLASRWPAFSPSGEEIVYLDADFNPFADLWRVPIAGGQPKRVTSQPALASAPVWSPDGKSIFYSSQRGGSRTLWRVNVADGSTRPLLFGSGDDDFPDISADGRQLIYSSRRERFALVRSGPDDMQQQELHKSRQMVLAPELSPDRTEIAFFAMAPDGGMQLYKMPVSGGAPKKLTSDPLATHAIPRWTADGQHLHFYYTKDGAALAKVSSSGGEAEFVVPGWDWTVTNGAGVSPDGTRIVYSRLTGQVPVQTLIRDLVTGEDQAFYATLEYPRWSRDGSSIIGSLHVDQRFPGDIAVCPVAGPECKIIARDARIPMWSDDESRIYYVRGFGALQELYVAPANGEGAERKLMTMAPLFPLGPFYDVTPDGDIVWVRYEQEPSEIWLTELGDM